MFGAKCSQCKARSTKNNIVLKGRVIIHGKAVDVCQRCKRAMGIGKRWGG